MNAMDRVRQWTGANKTVSQVLDGTTNEITLVKKIGDPVTVSVDVTDMALSNYVGFVVRYPYNVIEPVLAQAGQRQGPMLCTDGNLFAGLSVDLQCNALVDDDTGDKWVYVSKALKAGNPVATASARILSMSFAAIASGSGVLELVERLYGNSQDSTEYDSDADPLSLILRGEPAVVRARFWIVVE